MAMENGVWITQAELDVIGKLKRKPLKRLAFTILCIAKRGNLEYHNSKCLVSLGYEHNRKIRKLADVQHNGRDKCTEMIFSLIDKGLLVLDKTASNEDDGGGDGMFRVTFCEDKSERILYICNFNNLGNQYMDFATGKYIICENCGKIVENSKNNRRKYCEECQDNGMSEFTFSICEDYGHRYPASSKDHMSCRCRRCQAKRDREKNYQRQIRYRERKADNISAL